VISDKKMIEQFLSLQLGTRGFGDQIDKLLVIAFEVGVALGPRSRNQGYIDAGLFSMSLMYALLSCGVGACPLHWAVETPVDRKARQLIRLPDSQSIAMLLATGMLPERFEVARSNRRPVRDVLRYI
jgi:nitroreductase